MNTSHVFNALIIMNNDKYGYIMQYMFIIIENIEHED